MIILILDVKLRYIGFGRDLLQKIHLKKKLISFLNEMHEFYTRKKLFHKNIEEVLLNKFFKKLNADFV